MSSVRHERLDSHLWNALGQDICAFLREPAVTEVIANPDGRIWVDRSGEGRSDSEVILDESARINVIRLIATFADNRLSEGNAMVSGILPSGERFQGLVPPIALKPCFTIRKPPELIYSLRSYVDNGVLIESHYQLIREALEQRQNILIAGGTGSGKTTLANALLAEPEFQNDRVVILEDTRELQCEAKDKVQLLTSDRDPLVSMRDLVKTSLRLRPDRIVIGEVRDGSALDLLKAWNTGHPGGVSTLHANSAAEALSRLEDLIGEVSINVSRRSIAQAIDVVIFIKRTPMGRNVEHIVKVLDVQSDEYVIEEYAAKSGGKMPQK